MDLQVVQMQSKISLSGVFELAKLGLTSDNVRGKSSVDGYHRPMGASDSFVDSGAKAACSSYSYRGSKSGKSGAYHRASKYSYQQATTQEFGGKMQHTCAPFPVQCSLSTELGGTIAKVDLTLFQGGSLSSDNYIQLLNEAAKYDDLDTFCDAVSPLLETLTARIESQATSVLRGEDKASECRQTKFKVTFSRVDYEVIIHVMLIIPNGVTLAFPASPIRSRGYSYRLNDDGVANGVEGYLVPFSGVEVPRVTHAFKLESAVVTFPEASALDAYLRGALAGVDLRGAL